MVGAYLQDEINIIPVAKDSLGSVTLGEAVVTPARVKYEVKTILSDNGQEINSTAVLMLPADTVLNNDYKIQVTKIRGEAAPEPGKKYQVIKKGFAHGFSAAQSWLKVWVV